MTNTSCQLNYNIIDNNSNIGILINESNEDVFNSNIITNNDIGIHIYKSNPKIGSIKEK